MYQRGMLVDVCADVTTRKTTWYYPVKWDTYILSSKQLMDSTAVRCKHFYTVRNRFYIMIQYIHSSESNFFTTLNTNQNIKLISNLTPAKCPLIAPSLFQLLKQIVSYNM